MDSLYKNFKPHKQKKNKNKNPQSDKLQLAFVIFLTNG